MAAGPKTRSNNRSKKKAPKEVSYHKQPADMDLERWQAALRRQFAASNPFVVTKTSPERVFADYEVANPASGNTYKVALRSAKPGANYCSCFDFKINGLGTCKHIEAVFQYITNKRLKRHLKTEEPRSYSSVYVDYLDRRAVCLRIGTDAGTDLIDLAIDYFDDHLCLTEEGLVHFDVFLQKARDISPDFRCYEDALERVLELREHQRRVRKIRSLSASDRKKFLNGLLQMPLFPYQEEGVLFAYQNGRAVIGDEMGLGKTPQAVALAELMRREHHIEKVLILAPTSLKYQWKTEIEKFTGREEAVVVEGNALARKAIYPKNGPFYQIAGYHTALYDWAEMDAAGFDLIILDEAQRIKNWRTKIARSVRRIHTRYSVVLTGTPIENNLEELYGLIQFVDPFILGARHHFFKRYQITSDNGRIIGYQNLHEIRETLSNRLIRRTKKEVLTQLPKRSDKNLVIPMTPEQKSMHREYADQVAKLVAKWQRWGFLDEPDRKNLLKFLNLMRMVCDSTYIVDTRTNFQTKIDELRNILSDILEIEGEKVVVFSQWARMTGLVATALDEMGVSFRHLHGDVPGKDRGVLYDDFNRDPAVRVFLSTDAGGVGLNLQSAAWLVNLDVPWNPGVLEQRIGRIYRYGQEKPVNIINLVSQGTIEHNLLGVLQFKKSMAAGVLDAGDDCIFLGDDKFRKFMESVEMITGDAVVTGVTDDEARVDELQEQPDESAFPEPMLVAEEEESQWADEQEPQHREQASAHPQHGTGRPQSDQPAAQHLEAQTLVQDGIRFFSQLAGTLSDRDATARLVAQIVEKDEKTGQTYVKLPVESEAVVKDVFQLLGNLLQGVKQK